MPRDLELSDVYNVIGYYIRHQDEVKSRLTSVELGDDDLMTLEIDLSPELEEKLRKRAAAAGKDPKAFAVDALTEKVEGPETLAEILAPVHEEFRKSGMSQKELDALCERALSESRSDDQQGA